MWPFTQDFFSFRVFDLSFRLLAVADILLLNRESMDKLANLRGEKNLLSVVCSNLHCIENRAGGEAENESVTNLLAETLRYDDNVSSLNCALHCSVLVVIFHVHLEYLNTHGFSQCGMRQILSIAVKSSTCK